MAGYCPTPKCGNLVSRSAQFCTKCGRTKFTKQGPWKPERSETCQACGGRGWSNAGKMPSLNVWSDGKHTCGACNGKGSVKWGGCYAEVDVRDEFPE